MRSRQMYHLWPFFLSQLDIDVKEHVFLIIQLTQSHYQSINQSDNKVSLEKCIKKDILNPRDFSTFVDFGAFL